MNISMVNFLGRVIASTNDETVKSDALEMLEIEKAQIERSLGYKDIAWHLVPQTVYDNIIEAVDIGKDVTALMYLRKSIEMSLSEAKYHIDKLKANRTLSYINDVQSYITKM